MQGSSSWAGCSAFFHPSAGSEPPGELARWLVRLLWERRESELGAAGFSCTIRQIPSGSQLCLFPAPCPKNQGALRRADQATACTCFLPCVPFCSWVLTPRPRAESILRWTRTGAGSPPGALSGPACRSGTRPRAGPCSGGQPWDHPARGQACWVFLGAPLTVGICVTLQWMGCRNPEHVQCKSCGWAGGCTEVIRGSGQVGVSSAHCGGTSKGRNSLRHR